VTRYTYGPLQHLKSIIDQNGNTWTFSYDELGEKTSMDDPDLGVWRYTYDADWNLASQQDARLITTTFTYDMVNRLLTKVSGTQSESHTYDLRTPGTLSQVMTPDMTKDLYYDSRLRTTRETITYSGGPAFTTSYIYDALDRVTAMTLPDSTIINYMYNADKLSQIMGILTDITYNAFGEPTQRNYASGLQSTLTYDSLGRISHIGTGSLQNLDYTYDANGNILQIHDIASGETKTYTYDSLDRLTHAQDPGQYDISYTYDAIGNIQSARDTTAGTTQSFIYTGSPVIHSPHQMTQV